MRPESSFWIAPKWQFWSNLEVTIYWHDVIADFFWLCVVSLVSFSYWSKFEVNIITGSGIMTIFFYKGLTGNPEIGNTPVWFLPNIWRLGQVRDTKFGTKVSKYRSLKKLLQGVLQVYLFAGWFIMCYCLIIKFSGFSQCFLLCFLFPVCFFIYFT